MSCFCRQVVLPPDPPPEEEDDDERSPDVVAPPIVAALSTWLSARWLPPAVPWEPDPAWLDIPLSEPVMPPEAMSTLIRLVTAREVIVKALTLDPLVPTHRTQLTRVVATLNRRLPMLAPLAEDARPWKALAVLNDQADTILTALAAKTFNPEQVQPEDERQDPAQPEWRSLLNKMMKLLPVVTIVQLLKLDPTQPEALEQLAQTIRELRRVRLPPLNNPLLVMQLISRNDAIARLQDSLGPVPYKEAKRRVEEKVEEVMQELPPPLLSRMPPLQPNPALVINEPTVTAASRLSEKFIKGLNWKVPPQADLPLLTVGAPVATLVRGLAAAGVPRPVRLSPCDGQCDAQRALAEFAES